MKKTIAGRIMESVIGFDKWAEENKKKFLAKHQEKKDKPMLVDEDADLVHPRHPDDRGY